MRTCTIDHCDKPHRARGLCGTHYNQTNPNRHPKITVTCAACGTTALKDASSTRKYSRLYCSDLCKNYDRFGGCSSTIPATHWARWFGRTSEWTAPIVRNTGECAWCGLVNTRDLTAAYCGVTCKRRAKSVRRRGREHDAPGEYTWTQVVRLWLAFDQRCAYCTKPTPLTDLDPDHVTPLSRGGANSIHNILPSCHLCNADKRDLLLSEWTADRARRELAPVTTTWDADDRRYAHLITLTQYDLAA